MTVSKPWCWMVIQRSTEGTQDLGFDIKTLNHGLKSLIEIGKLTELAAICREEWGGIEQLEPQKRTCFTGECRRKLTSGS